MSQIIKKALAACADGTVSSCMQCPYRKLEKQDSFDISDCWAALLNDTLAYIDTLEQRLKEASADAGRDQP